MRIASLSNIFTEVVDSASMHQIEAFKVSLGYQFCPNYEIERTTLINSISRTSLGLLPLSDLFSSRGSRLTNNSLKHLLNSQLATQKNILNSKENFITLSNPIQYGTMVFSKIPTPAQI